MFSDLIVDLPLAVIGYVAIVLAISKYLEFSAGDTPAAPTHQKTVSENPHEDARRDAEPHETLVSTSENWAVTEEGSQDKPHDANVTLFDSETGEVVKYEDVELSHVPTDAVLHRHYIQYLLMMLQTLRDEPTDSQLRRHYYQYLEYRIESLLADRSAVDLLEAEYEARHLSF
jgi:hypothetical protein